MRFQEFITESINDKGILKSVFFAGYPGSGKTTISKLIKDGALPIMNINSDIWTEWYKDMYGLDDWVEMGNDVKRLTKQDAFYHINGLLPIFIDTTGSNIKLFKRRLEYLMDIGYDTKMFFIDVSFETTKDRADRRFEAGGRYISPEFLEKAYNEINKVKSIYKQLIPDFTVIKNNDNEVTPNDIRKLYAQTVKYFNSPIKNEKGKKLVDYMREMGYHYYNQIPDEWKKENGYPVIDKKSIDWFNKKR